MDPYQTDVPRLPPTDLYADVPLPGRYQAQPGDFVPAPRLAADVSYWDGVLEPCKPETGRVGPNVAWPYLSAKQKAKFEEQVRWVVRKLLAPRDMGRESRGHVVEDTDSACTQGYRRGRRHCCFDTYREEELGFAHHDLKKNAFNIIVKTTWS
ncbi:MAG: hypothetical protein M1832_005879 [Thelocarpon impressellum]|nr:MAG: hypothetical protein M1832_005879 [Thelocarpon impressellum]